jgi:hypothetical protein
MELHEGLTYEHEAERREPYVRQISYWVEQISDDQSKRLVRKVKNRYGVEIWPWDRAGFRNIPPIKTKLKAVKARTQKAEVISRLYKKPATD